MEITFITPIAPHHEQQFVRCADSVRKQTIACRHLHMIDTEHKGPGYIRNLLLKQVKTPFVVFLDADDYIEPDFAYECLMASQPGKYVYTDWWQGTQIKATPKGAFWDTAWHLVTCLLHTSMVRLVGGFDEQLPVMEDTKLFLEFDKHDYCGIQLNKPLVHYTNEGKRSADGRANGAVKQVKQMLSRRYIVGCCGGDVKINNTPIGAKQKNDVLVMPKWEGNRVIIGMMTGRRYGRGAKPRKVWMDRRDAQAQPALFHILDGDVDKNAIQAKVKKKSHRIITDKPSTVKKRTLQDVLVAAGMLREPYVAPLPVVAGAIAPNFAALDTIAKRIYANV